MAPRTIRGRVTINQEVTATCIRFPFVKKDMFVSVRRGYCLSLEPCFVCGTPIPDCEGDDVGLLVTEQGNKVACENCVGELLERMDMEARDL